MRFQIILALKLTISSATGRCRKTAGRSIAKAAGLFIALPPLTLAPLSAAEMCAAQSASTRATVIELYTSEGCSSCPPADQWLSSIKASQSGSGNVIQAFHVGYWDYIGWVDRFATPAHTTRQRKLASLNRLSSIYTPQIVRDGQDLPDWHRVSTSSLGTAKGPASVQIAMKQVAPDQFEAVISPADSLTGNWSAYWTVTEHGHSSKVKSGENAGEFLRHDYVVRQYTAVGDYPLATPTPQKLTFRSIAATPGHARQINLVVYDTKSGKTLQAVTASC